jgi:hypothetical protein
MTSSGHEFTHLVPSPPSPDEIYESTETDNNDSIYEPTDVYLDKQPASRCNVPCIPPRVNRSLPPVPVPHSPSYTTGIKPPPLPPSNRNSAKSSPQPSPISRSQDDEVYEQTEAYGDRCHEDQCHEPADVPKPPTLSPARHHNGQTKVAPGKQAQLSSSSSPVDEIKYEVPEFEQTALSSPSSLPVSVTVPPRKPPSMPDIPIAKCQTEDKRKLAFGAQPVHGVSIGSSTIKNVLGNLRPVANKQTFVTPDSESPPAVSNLQLVSPVVPHVEVHNKVPLKNAPSRVMPPSDKITVIDSPGGSPVQPMTSPGAPQEAEPDRPQQAADPLSHFPWYFSNIDRKAATQKVTEMRQDGAFLVRLSEKGGIEFPYTLCVLHNGEASNIQIRKREEDNKFALGKKKPKETVHSSVHDLIRFHQNNDIELSKTAGPCGTVKLTVSPPK